MTRLITRRSFIRWAAAGAVAPYIVPSSALGSGRRAAPSERLNLAIIGIKKQGGYHVQNLLGWPEVQLVAICDVDATAREAVRQKIERYYAGERRDDRFSGCDAYNEYERILERPDIDAVVIAAPDHWHALMTIAACRAGKDVYCEKPLSLTVREARAMVNAARHHGRIVQTGSQQRSGAEFRRACELVRGGFIGDVQRVHVEIGPCSRHLEFPEEPVPPGFDYDRWLGPAPWAPYSAARVGSNYWDGWRRFRDYSGGKMTDWGAHFFDIVQWGLGMDDSGPVEIVPPPPRPDAGWDKLPAKLEGAGAVPGDPTRGLIFRYASGVEAIKDGRNGILFVGSAGEVEVNRGHLRTKPESLKSAPLGPNDVHLPESNDHYANWFECIRTRKLPIADVEIGCRSVTMCHLGNIALWTHRAIRWDPQTEQIVGDDEAARWLSRPMRAPYRL